MRRLYERSQVPVWLRSVTGTRFGLAHLRRDINHARLWVIRRVIVGRAGRCHPCVTPPELHAPACGQIIDAGLDVLLEKPMAITVDECESLLENARRAKGVKLGVGHNFLFAPIYDQLKQDLVAGRLGLLDEVSVTWNKGLGQLQSGPFNLWMLREPGNIILEVGSHSVAHMLDLVGPVRSWPCRLANCHRIPQWYAGSSAGGVWRPGAAAWRNVEFFVRTGIF